MVCSATWNTAEASVPSTEVGPVTDSDGVPRATAIPPPTSRSPSSARTITAYRGTRAPASARTQADDQGEPSGAREQRTGRPAVVGDLGGQAGGHGSAGRGRGGVG